MTPLRVLHAISGIDPRNGGPTNALIGLAAAQQRAGLSVRVISTWQEQDAFQSARRLEESGVGVRMVGQAHGKLSRHPDLVRALEEEVTGADVIHVHAMWEEIQHQACRAAQRAGRSYVMRPTGMLDPWNMRKNRLMKQAYLLLRMRSNLQRAALLHFTSELERRWVARLKLRPPTVVEPLGLDLAEYQNLPPKGEFRQKYPQIDNRPVILFLGRVHYGKGLEVLIPAMEQMRRRDALLVVAGPESAGYGEIVRALSSEVTSRTIYTGLIGGRDKLAALVDADLLSLPSFHENFALSVIEALACGTPAVISDQVGLHPEITAAGVGAVVPLDASVLAKELDRWLDDGALRHAAAEKGPALVRERYDWDQIARRWVEHYHSLARR